MLCFAFNSHSTTLHDHFFCPGTGSHLPCSLLSLSGYSTVKLDINPNVEYLKYFKYFYFFPNDCLSVHIG